MKHTLTVTNNLGVGNVIIDGTERPCYYPAYKLTNESLGVGAINQNNVNGYNWIWSTTGSNISNWNRNNYPIGGATSSSYSYTVASNDNGASISAPLKKVCNATFQSPGQLTVNGSSYTGSASISVVDQNTVPVSVPSLIVSSDWINYSFVNWTWQSGSNSNSSFSPSVTAHTTYTANYTATTANPSPMGIQFTSTNGNPISLSWNEHPNSSVTQYQVWRYKAGESASAIATLSRGTTSFIDYMYIQNPNGDAKLFYTVKAYYSPSGLWNDPGYIQNRGDIDLKLASNTGSDNNNASYY